jgi:hypothetical protein
MVHLQHIPNHEAKDLAFLEVTQFGLDASMRGIHLHSNAGSLVEQINIIWQMVDMFLNEANSYWCMI